MNNKILILGGGIAGLTMAHALEKIGMGYIVLEAVPEIKAIGAGITLAGNAMRTLEQLNVADSVKSRGELLTAMIVQDYHGRPIQVMKTEKLYREHGMYNVAIHRGALHEALLEKLPAEKIVTNKKAVGYSEGDDGVTILFGDGAEWKGPAAIIADGIHSSIRKQVLPEALPRYSGYTCWRAVVEFQHDLNGVAYEIWGPAGRFGYVPIGKDLVYWFACKNAPAKDECMKNFTSAVLAENFKKYAHPVYDIIRDTPDENLIWSDIIDLKPTSRYAFNHLVCIGDAAHATTPNLGQGACMAIDDAAALAEEIQREPGNLAKAFKAFEQKRIAHVNYVVNTSYQLGKLAQLENSMLSSLRNTVLRLVPDSFNEKQLKKILRLPSR